MKPARPPARLRRGLGAALAALLCLGLLFASIAHAEFEQVPERFGTSGEASALLLGKVRGLAVNAAGAGGVPAGSFYAVTEGRVVVRFSPGAEGEDPQFEEAWGWEIGAENGGGFQRCGPALTTDLAAQTYHTCAEPRGGPPPVTDEPGHFAALSSVAVDQTNGFVYVRNTANESRKRNLIEVFTATGTPVGEGFGESGNRAAVPPGSISEEPGKLHEGALSQESLTIGDNGIVYLTDSDYPGVEGPPVYRVMSFEPEGGNDFEHYVYTGVARDLRVSQNQNPNRIAWAGNNHLVTARFEQVHEYRLNPPSTEALCNLNVSGRLTALTANPVTGEVFYFNESKSAIARLGPCNEGTHKFTQLQQLKPEPVTEAVAAMAVNPSRAWSSLRPAGTLYVPTEFESATRFEFFGDIFATTPVLSPIVEAESVANTGITSTTLLAKINPRGVPTRYGFEYLSAAAYDAQLAAAELEGKSGAAAEDAAFAGALIAPSGIAEIPGSGVSTATASASGLTADTLYRFRAVVSSECSGPGEPRCEAAGAASVFATYPSVLAGLPDGRAYELVSPPQKNGGEVFPAEAEIGSCGTHVCKPPGGLLSKVNPMQSAPDGNRVTYMGYPFSATEGAVLNSYVSRRTPEGWRTVSETPAQQLPKSLGTFAYNANLEEGTVGETLGKVENQILLRTAEEPFTQTDLIPGPRYRGAEELRVEYGGYSPDFSSQFFSANDSLTSATNHAPEPPDPGLAGSDLYEWHGGQLSLINVLPGNTVASGATFASKSPDVNWVSADGSHVFWQAGASLYVREDGETTRQIEDPGSFVAASENGETVLLSDGCLYALSAEGCVDLTEGSAGFKGLAAADGDLSRIYFVDSAKLPGSGMNDLGLEAVVGKPNLYFYEAGAPTRFVGTLAASDGEGGAAALLNDWGVSRGQRTAEASPDGRYLTFVSTEGLTGYDNVGPCERVTNSNNEPEIVSDPCKEVFLYDSVTGRLECPSCNPTGEAPLGNSTLRRITGAKPYFPQPRYLTNAGRLFFDSSDRLSAQDTNGGVEDVYESEPGGVGSCPRLAGCVLLLSPGTGTVDSNFLAMGGEGSNVFFTTRERLVPSDTDEQIDLYDAREGGGFPGEGETGRSECRGEACQSTANAPVISAPGSSSFQGSGNLKPKKPVRCPKGKVKKHGKCVKRTKKAKKPRSSSKKAPQHGHKRANHSNRGGAK